MANQTPKKKTKEQIYKELQGVAASPYTFISDAHSPIREKLQEQITSQYPLPYKDEQELNNNLKKLVEDMQLDKVTVSPHGGSSEYYNLPRYLHEGESYDIDELPKESNPNSFTKFLGRLDPFKQEVALSPEDRMNDLIKYSPIGYGPNSLGQTLVGLGKIKDFRQGRLSGEDMYKDRNIDFKRSSTDNPRIVNSAYLGVNPITLDEMIEAPGTGKIRFKKLQERLAKEKAKQRAIDAAKQQVEDEEVDELMKNR